VAPVNATEIWTALGVFQFAPALTVDRSSHAVQIWRGELMDQ
jgi:hypothetical protein